MLHDKQLITVDSSLWEAIGRRAEHDRLSTEAWLRRQLHADHATPIDTSAEDGDEIVLDLVVRHFRDQRLSRDEQKVLADTLLMAIDTGEPGQVGPIGALRRHYRIQRRVSAVTIRVGEGQVSLPLGQALRLSALLDGDDRLQMESVIAA